MKPDFTIGDVARMACISNRTVQRLVADGKLHALRYNARVIRIPHDSWLAYRKALEAEKATGACRNSHQVA